MPVHSISDKILTLQKLREIVEGKQEIQLSPKAIARVEKCRQYLDERLRNADGLIYGINTGFGSLCDVVIPPAELRKLQDNLVRSHACGVGEPVPVEIVRIMLLLKIQSLAYGYSGVQVSTIERLIYFYNNDLLPLVYSQGSLGASGDLAPLAHLCLPLIGEGEFYDGEIKRPAQEVLREHKLKALDLEAKEGLALLNGTQFMGAYGVYCLLEAERLSALADLTAALSIDAWFCKSEPFLPFIHKIRPHNGQLQTAENILAHLGNSKITNHPKVQVQDPYAFRCIPQVHGASKDAIAHVRQVFEVEMNSVTDNPNVFPEEDLVLSGGNFHGQPLALTMDYFAIAMAELGNISERRTFNMLSGKRNLPEFLVANPGLNSGLMIPQYTAAALVSQNKQLCTPASVDSITSSNGQEDHVSMGGGGAIKLYRVIQNLKHILAIEWLTAAQAIHFRRPLKTSTKLEKLLASYRAHVPFIEQDRILSNDIRETVEFMDSL